MTALFAALLGIALATEPLHVYEPVLDDLPAFAPDVLPDEALRGGEIRVEGGGALVLQHTEVVAQVHAGMATVTLIQWFANPYDEPLEATYLFPLPDNAAVYRMDMTVGDRLIEGFVMERDAAREVYVDALAEGRRAALLEQERDNLFTQSIGGLCPGELVQITLEYVHEVHHEDGLYELVIPTTLGERFTPPGVDDGDRLVTTFERSGRDIDITVLIEEGMPIEALFSDTHGIDVVEEGLWGGEIRLTEDDRIPNRDFSLTWSLAGTAPRAAVLAHRPDADEPGYLALSLEPQILGDLFEARPRELLFVVDASCSMRGEPYDTAVGVIELALQQMRPGDTFNLVRFSTEASSLFERPQRSTALTREKAGEWLEHFEGGGTQMSSGIVHSLTMPGDAGSLRLVLLLTDGFIGNEEEIFATVREHRGDARLFSLGVSASPNRMLLEGLAEMGRGDVTYQLPYTPISETVETFYRRIAHPGMSHIRIDWGDLAVTEQYPKRLPDLWVGQPLRVVARYEGGGPDFVTVHGVVGRERFQLEVPIDPPEVTAENVAVSKLWARRKIRDIEWYPRGRTPAEVQQDVTEVALDHHLVSRYTSLVAVDDVESPCGSGSLEYRVPSLVPSGMAGYGSGGLGSSGSGYGGGGSGTGTYGFGLRGTGGWGGGPGAGGSGGVGGLVLFGSGSGSSGYGSGSGHFGGRQVGSPRVDHGSGIALGTKGIGGGGGTYGSPGSGGVGGVGGDPIILGSLDRSLISEVVKRHLPQIRYCYQRELTKDPTLAGKITVKFIITDTGLVSSAEVTSSTMGNEAVESCVVGRFLRMKFPPDSSGIVIVKYPFVFAADE